MQSDKSFEQDLIFNAADYFNELALRVFAYQYENNNLYREYCNLLNRNPTIVKEIEQVPFLPIRFFKSHKIQSEFYNPEMIFESSGTTSEKCSKHHLHSLKFYQNISEQIFQCYYGPLNQYHIIALLPSYLERDTSSLVYMVQHFINQSGSKYSGFYLHNFDKLRNDLKLAIKATDKKILLIGVSFALLDFIEEGQIDLSGHIVMETGGMKGRRKELIRAELHQLLCDGLNVDVIHSEYGMTELLSQAYSQGNGLFKTPSTMQIVLRDLYDPLNLAQNQRQGGINVIDLANYRTCSFIETEDIGRYSGDFVEVIGRFDNSEIRGCNLMI